MKPDKLTVGNLAPYLEHGLKFQGNEFTDGEPFELYKLWMGNIHGKGPTATLHCYAADESETIYLNSSLEQPKPILRPLSDLTKPITVKGEELVPLERIFAMWYDNIPNTVYKISKTGFEYSFSHWQYDRYEIRIEFQEFVLRHNTYDGSELLESNAVEYTIYDQLNKWHFDTQNLIEANLAVNVNDLPQNPYE